MNRLRAERKSRGWSQAELARRAELNATTVGLIENGRLMPYPVQLAKLGRALGLEGEDVKSLVEDARPSAGRQS